MCLTLIERDDPAYTQPEPYLGTNPPAYPDNCNPFPCSIASVFCCVGYFPDLSPSSRTNYAGLASVMMVNVVTMIYVYLALIERDDPVYTQPDPYLGPNPPAYPDNRDPLKAALEDEDKLIVTEKEKKKAKENDKTPASGDDNQDQPGSSDKKPETVNNSKNSEGTKESDSNTKKEGRKSDANHKGVGDLADDEVPAANSGDCDTTTESEKSTLRSRKRGSADDSQ